MEALKFAKIAAELGYDAPQLIPPSTTGVVARRRFSDTTGW